MDMKYPNQICAIKRKDKTLGVDALLYIPTDKDNAYPLEMHSGFSRFVFTIIDKSAGSTPITPRANIPAGEATYIMAKTKIALEYMFSDNTEQCTTQPGEFSNSPAYTVKLSDKKYKGMSPAEIILANPENCEDLERIKKWLQSNLEKYPGNSKQIEAINQAIALNDIGELNVTPASASTDRKPVVLYSSDTKFMSEKNDKGYNRVYEISIVCDPDKKYPFVVNILNYYAPVEDAAGGQKRVRRSEAEGHMKSSLMLTEKEWFGLISRTVSTLQCFENMNFEKLYKKAQENSFHH